MHTFPCIIMRSVSVAEGVSDDPDELFCVLWTWSVAMVCVSRSHMAAVAVWPRSRSESVTAGSVTVDVNTHNKDE